MASARRNGGNQLHRPPLGISDGLLGHEGEVVDCPGADEAHGFLVAGFAEETLAVLIFGVFSSKLPVRARRVSRFGSISAGLLHQAAGWLKVPISRAKPRMWVLIVNPTTAARTLGGRVKLGTSNAYTVS
jgi:hypothetical protein